MSDFEHEDEGVKNLREELKRLKTELEQKDQAIAEREQADAARALAEREAQLKSAFKDVGLTEQMASLYPEDQDVSADAVANWAQTYGIAPQRKEPEPENDLDRINRLTSNAWNNSDEISDVAQKLIKGVYDAHTRNTRPSSKEIEEAEELRRWVNDKNRMLERAVQEGRAKPFGTDGVAAYGGRVNPPEWADATAQARAKL